MAAIGMLFSIFGMYMTYAAAQQQAAYQAAVAERDAQNARNQAEQEKLDRAVEEKEERKGSRQNLAKIESMYAASGVLVDGTSAEDAMVEQVKTDEFNILNQNRKSKNRRNQLEAQADLSLWDGLMKVEATKMQRNASLVDQAGSMFSSMGGGGGKKSGGSLFGKMGTGIKNIGDDSKIFG